MTTLEKKANQFISKINNSMRVNTSDDNIEFSWIDVNGSVKFKSKSFYDKYDDNLIKTIYQLEHFDENIYLIIYDKNKPILLFDELDLYIDSNNNPNQSIYDLHANVNNYITDLNDSDRIEKLDKLLK